MHNDYYQNTLYPLQDKVLEIVGKLSVGFYLTGGTALSRAYLHHRYSDDLDFFVNGVSDFKMQVNTVIKALTDAGNRIDISVADDGFARIFVFDGESPLKLDFVNDVPFRSGTPVFTPLFNKTDNLNNILSNKITALGRYSTKDIVDIVYICESLKFNWENIMNDASEKDLWVNPVNIMEVLEKFPVEKLEEINWMIESPTHEWFNAKINQIIPDILDGGDNSLHE
ncbi:MAG: hypothetical protein EOM59_13440 [Clostridia bacterium]|jgi:hypothetical protein|nr:nucleotidyl transferase AbiEii/AbiGii toxin family protein [Bacteroidales bacterium]MDY0279123.1 nucleotidyl transferase AbiEii/AbiGii toxin family protein [Salinivirgaceae bacterium]NCB43603.1 hypothetical protein [Clostridia bacterium]